MDRDAVSVIQPVRIYADESGTHGGDWLVIGMLFVRDHGPLHSDLLHLKKSKGYLNRSPKRKAVYRETHFRDISSRLDVEVACESIDLFAKHDTVFRSIVVDWSTWDGKYFGGPFETDAYKKRKAYKKWAEMLLHPEALELKGAQFYLDRLRILYGYDVVQHLQERFTKNYQGTVPRIASFQHTEAWKDANQCLQLCDILVGAVYRALVPPGSAAKREVTDYVFKALAPFGVKNGEPWFWKGYASTTLRDRFPKFSEWFWRPQR